MAKSKKDKQVKAVPTQYDKAKLVEKVAKKLIPRYHPHLINSKIAYLYKNKEITRNGKKTLATAEKCSPKVKALTDYDFIITVAYPDYRDLTDRQRVAVIDHELEHCFVEDGEDGETKIKMLPHDFEEFGDIIRRHGLWQPDLQELGRVVETTKDVDPVEVALMEDNESEDAEDDTVEEEDVEDAAEQDEEFLSVDE